MNQLQILKRGINPIIAELENLRYELIDLIEQNVIKGMSALKPMSLLVQTQILNLVNFLKQMKELIE